jgi:hypothetical protein
MLVGSFVHGALSSGFGLDVSMKDLPDTRIPADELLQFFFELSA